MDKLLNPYRSKVNELQLKIGTVDRKLEAGGMGAGSLGGFVADGVRAEVSARLRQTISLVITNSGGLRKSSLAEGDLRVSDIFELLPFENKLIAMDLTGDQLLALLRVVLARRHPQSGARITYRFSDKKPELISAKLLSSSEKEREIVPAETYRLVTIDYLLDLQSGGYSMLQQAKNIRPVGLTLRDAIIAYVKSQTGANRGIHPSDTDRFKLIGPGPETGEKGNGGTGKGGTGEEGKKGKRGRGIPFPVALFLFSSSL
jgi:2',3'-cyclic-nucleotide 2'-phosphodiesterase (5'-nucleotidase family)